MAMRYGAITSRRGTRREIGRMSAAGDQGEAQRAWQEVEKRDKAGVATRDANRGARRGRERDFHNITPPSGRGLFEDIDELTKLVVRLVPRDDLLAVDAAGFVSGLLGAMNVPLDALDAERMAALEGLRALRVHGVLAVTAVRPATEAAELLAVGLDDAVHKQDLHEDFAVLGGEVVVRVAFSLVVGPLESLAEPVEATEVEWRGFLAGAACAGGMNGIVQCYVFVGREASGRRRLVASEVDVVASGSRRDLGFGLDAERVGGEGARTGGASVRGRGR